MRCGLYLRISREDGVGESDSIANQRLMLCQYLEEHPEMVLAGEWVDDGWSGSRFDRPGFREMMAAAERGELDCILIKDLSRLGREYIQTGYYLQDIFPRMGIRLIAVADRYDSGQAEFLEQSLLLPVLNLMNDAYCRDISAKVRWQQRTKRQAGEYIGAFAVYGYRKNERNVHRLEVDEDVRKIICCIYWLRLAGMSAENIANALNAAGIPGPAQYKREKGSRYRSGFDKEGGSGNWSPLAVRRILKNRMYTGAMVQGKDRKISYKLSVRRKLPPEQWIIVEGKVPVIIPKWLWDRTQEVAAMRLRCAPGERYCGMWDGIWKGKSGGGWDWLAELVLHMISGEKDVHGRFGERWMRRLFLVLFFREVTCEEEEKKIYVSLCVQGFAGKGGKI